MNEPTEASDRASDEARRKHLHELDPTTTDVLSLTRDFGEFHVTTIVSVYPCGCVGLAGLRRFTHPGTDVADLLVDGEIPPQFGEFVAEVVRLGQMQAQVRKVVTQIEQALAGGVQ